MTTSMRAEPSSPWHAGERAIQREAGVAAEMEPIGRRAIRDHLNPQHAAFYPRLPFVVAGAVDPAGDVWATLLAGEPGFLGVPNPLTLAVAALRDGGDPADAGLDDGASVGLLGIELHSRRRNRVNGVVHRGGPRGFTVSVRESFGNCPKYIHLRDARIVRDPGTPAAAPPEALQALDAAARATVAAADTLFIASFIDEPGTGRRVDASHRGGRSGFVHLDEDGMLTIPDFSGNRFFNTLGNVHANPKAGLVFVDFASGHLLQLTGPAAVSLHDPLIAAFDGAERLLRIRPHRIVRRRNALPLRWTATDGGTSPQALRTGDWTTAQRRLRSVPA